MDQERSRAKRSREEEGEEEENKRQAVEKPAAESAPQASAMPAPQAEATQDDESATPIMPRLSLEEAAPVPPAPEAASAEPAQEEPAEGTFLCPCCYERFVDGTANTMQLPCGHKMCVVCFLKDQQHVLMNGGTSRCMYCRQPVIPVEPVPEPVPEPAPESAHAQEAQQPVSARLRDRAPRALLDCIEGEYTDEMALLFSLIAGDSLGVRQALPLVPREDNTIFWGRINPLELAVGYFPSLAVIEEICEQVDEIDEATLIDCLLRPSYSGETLKQMFESGLEEYGDIESIFGPGSSNVLTLYAGFYQRFLPISLEENRKGVYKIVCQHFNVFDYMANRERVIEWCQTLQWTCPWMQNDLISKLPAAEMKAVRSDILFKHLREVAGEQTQAYENSLIMAGVYQRHQRFVEAFIGEMDIKIFNQQVDEGLHECLQFSILKKFSDITSRMLMCGVYVNGEIAKLARDMYGGEHWVTKEVEGCLQYYSMIGARLLSDGKTFGMVREWSLLQAYEVGSLVVPVLQGKSLCTQRIKAVRPASSGRGHDYYIDVRDVRPSPYGGHEYYTRTTAWFHQEKLCPYLEAVDVGSLVSLWVGDESRLSLTVVSRDVEHLYTVKDKETGHEEVLQRWDICPEGDLRLHSR